MEITKDNVDKCRERTLEFGYSFFKSKVLLTAVRLDIFNIIGEKGLSAGNISAKIDSNVCATETFLDAIVSLDLLQKGNNNILTQKKEKKYL